jgi:hypothetical protein
MENKISEKEIDFIGSNFEAVIILAECFKGIINPSSELIRFINHFSKECWEYYKDFILEANKLREIPKEQEILLKQFELIQSTQPNKFIENCKINEKDERDIIQDTFESLRIDFTNISDCKRVVSNHEHPLRPFFVMALFEIDYLIYMIKNHNSAENAFETLSKTKIYRLHQLEIVNLQVDLSRWIGDTKYPIFNSFWSIFKNFLPIIEENIE